MIILIFSNFLNLISRAVHIIIPQILNLLLPTFIQIVYIYLIFHSNIIV